MGKFSEGFFGIFLEFFAIFLENFYNFLENFYNFLENFPKIFAIFFNLCDFLTIFPENFSENSRSQSVTVQPGSRHIVSLQVSLHLSLHLYL